MQALQRGENEMRNGKLSKWELTTLDNACNILSDWVEFVDNDDLDYAEASGWQYDTARSIVDRLRDFVDSYEA